MNMCVRDNKSTKGFLVAKAGVCLILTCMAFVSLSDGVESSTANNSHTLIDINVGLVLFPPNIQQSAGNECFGSAVDTLHETFPETRYKLHVYCATPARVYSDFEHAKIDMTINIKTTQSLPKEAFFSEDPVQILDVMLYSRNGKKLSTISAIRRFSYHGIRNQLILEGRTIIDQANSKEAIVTFLRGGTDGLISYRRPFEFYFADIVSNNSFMNNTSDYTEEKLVSVPTYIVINPKSQHSKRLISELTKQE